MTPPEEQRAEPAAPLSPDLEPAAERLEEEATRSLGKENRKVLLLVLGVAAFMALAHFTPLRAWITNVQAWKSYVRELGLLAHLFFGLACAGAVMLGVPRLALCAGAGLVFGFVEGGLLSLMGSTLGSYGAFLLARKGARKAVLARAERWPWLKGMLAKPTLMRVFWVRQLTLPGIVLNVLLGVSGVRKGTFLGGTLLGYLPLNIAFSLVGSGLGKGQDSLVQSMTQLLMAVAVVNIVGWAMWRVVMRAKQNKPDQA